MIIALMLFSFFFSLAFATSPTPAIVGEEIQERSFGPSDERILTMEGFEKMLSAIKCDSYTLERTDEEPLRKSEIVEEVYRLLLEKGEEFPTKSLVIRFRDIEENDSYLKAAQGLVALGILELQDARFGTGEEKNPFIQYEEAKVLLERAFITQECGFLPNTDRDRDGIENIKDSCPLIPGTDDGCPQFPKRTRTDEQNDFVEVKKTLTGEEQGFIFFEKTDIRPKDLFRAVVRGKWGEDLSVSNVRGVEN